MSIDRHEGVPPPRSHAGRSKHGPITVRQSCFVRLDRRGLDSDGPAPLGKGMTQFCGDFGAAYVGAEVLRPAGKTRRGKPGRPEVAYDWYRVPLHGSRTLSAVQAALSRLGLPTGPAGCGPFWGTGRECTAGGAGLDCVAKKAQASRKAAVRQVAQDGFRKELVLRLFGEERDRILASARTAKHRADSLPQDWPHKAPKWFAILERWPAFERVYNAVMDGWQAAMLDDDCPPDVARLWTGRQKLLDAWTRGELRDPTYGEVRKRQRPHGELVIGGACGYDRNPSANAGVPAVDALPTQVSRQRVIARPAEWVRAGVNERGINLAMRSEFPIRTCFAFLASVEVTGCR